MVNRSLPPSPRLLPPSGCRPGPARGCRRPHEAGGPRLVPVLLLRGGPLLRLMALAGPHQPGHAEHRRRPPPRHTPAPARTAGQSRPGRPAAWHRCGRGGRHTPSSSLSHTLCRCVSFCIYLTNVCTHMRVCYMYVHMHACMLRVCAYFVSISLCLSQSVFQPVGCSALSHQIQFPSVGGLGTSFCASHFGHPTRASELGGSVRWRGATPQPPLSALQSFPTSPCVARGAHRAAHVL